MGVRVGIDLFRVTRMEAALRRGNPVYFAQLFTPRECQAGQASDHPTVWFAERLALKEAAFKSLGTSWTEEMAWNQIEALPAPCGGPEITLSGAMAAAAFACGVRSLTASVSHETDFVIAIVAAEAPAKGLV